MAQRPPSKRTPASRSKEELAAECWQRMWSFFMAHRDVYVSVAFEHGLTPPHMNALLSLEPGDAQPMRALAEQWRCDASNVTWLVDRLEDRGLVARRPSPTDRRVKTVVLTEEGVRTRAELMDALFYQAPDSFLAFSKGELAQFHEHLSKLAPPLTTAMFAGPVLSKHMGLAHHHQPPD